MSAESDVSVMLGDPRRAIRTMAVPLFLALVVVQINTIADRAWCSGLGPDALAAIAICGPIYMVLTGLGTGLGVGGAATVARHIGADDAVGASSCAKQSLLFSLAFGLVLVPPLVLVCEDLLVLVGSGDFTDVAYDYMIWLMAATPVLILNGVVSGLLRGEGAARMATVMMCTMAVANIVLDPILIYSLDMGIAGASIATVIATILSTLVGFRYYLRSGYVGAGMRGSGMRREDLRDILSVGVPQMVEYTVMYAMNLVLNWLVVWCAGSEGLAIYSVPDTILMVALLPAYAVGSALIPVASSALGQGDMERMSDAYRYSLKMSFCLVAVLTVVLFAVPGPLLLPFTYSDATMYLREDMAQALRIYSLCIPFYFLIPVCSSYLQAMGRSDWSLVCALVRNLVFIAMYAVAGSVALYWIFWAVVAGSVVGGLMLLPVVNKGFRRLVPGESPGV